MKKLVALSAIATMAATPAFASLGDVLPTGTEVGLGLSATSGLNGFVGYANKNFESFWLKRLGVRFDFASTTPIKSTINSLIDKHMGDGIELGDYMAITDGTIKSKHIGLLVDIYPFGDTWFLGGWRLSAGYMIGEMNIKANLTGKVDELPSDEVQFQLGDTYYKYLGNTLNGTAKAKWDFSGPYVGTGFDLGLFRGFKIFMDAGVVFTSKAAELSLDVPTDNLQQSNTGLPGSWTTVNISQLDDAKDEALSDAQEKLDEYKFFPMVKLGFMYRF